MNHVEDSRYSRQPMMFASDPFLMSGIAYCRLAIVFVFVLIAIVVPAFLNASSIQQDIQVIGQFEDPSDVGDEEGVITADLIPVLMERIDPTGERGFRVRLLENNKVEFLFPNATHEEVDRIWRRLTTTGNLVFRIVASQNRNPVLIQTAKQTTNQLATNIYRDDQAESEDPKQIGQWVRMAREQQDGDHRMDQRPFKLMPRETYLLRDAESGEIIEFKESMFNAQDRDGRREQFNDWCMDNDHYAIDILVCWPSKERQDVEGRFVSRAGKGVDGLGRPRIEFSLNSVGAKRMFSLTSRHKPVGGRYCELGIVFDDQLLAAARINSAIRNAGVIEGNFTAAEVDDMIAALNSGKLDLPLQKEWISFTEKQSGGFSSKGDGKDK